MRKLTSSLALLALLVPLAAEAKPGKVERREPGLRWATDLDAAIQEARDRNIPLWVALHKDH
jgi:hypothetical protein